MPPVARAIHPSNALSAALSARDPAARFSGDESPAAS
jgi:hypothetical protein